MLLELGLKLMTSVGPGTLLRRKMFPFLGLVINKQCMLSYWSTNSDSVCHGSQWLTKCLFPAFCTLSSNCKFKTFLASGRRGSWMHWRQSQVESKTPLHYFPTHLTLAEQGSGHYRNCCASWNLKSNRLLAKAPFHSLWELFSWRCWRCFKHNTGTFPHQRMYITCVRQLTFSLNRLMLGKEKGHYQRQQISQSKEKALRRDLKALSAWRTKQLATCRDAQTSLTEILK